MKSRSYRKRKVRSRSYRKRKVRSKSYRKKTSKSYRKRKSKTRLRSYRKKTSKRKSRSYKKMNKKSKWEKEREARDKRIALVEKQRKQAEDFRRYREKSAEIERQNQENVILSLAPGALERMKQRQRINQRLKEAERARESISMEQILQEEPPTQQPKALTMRPKERSDYVCKQQAGYAYNSCLSLGINEKKCVNRFNKRYKDCMKEQGYAPNPWWL